MATRPEPPANPDTAAELAVYVSQHPEDWILYLRNIDGYTTSVEKENATLRAAVHSHDSAISSLQTEVTKRDAIIGYQKEQLNERDKQNIERTVKAAKKIGQLEVKKAQLLATAIPVIYTLLTNAPLAANLPAKPLADTAPRIPTPAPASRTGPAFISEKLPDLEKFDRSCADLQCFIQQIYTKMKANADRFLTATSYLTYIAGQLTGRAYELILLKISNSLP